MRKYLTFFKYIFFKSRISVSDSSDFYISPSAKLLNATIYVAPGAQLKIAGNVQITNAMICVEKGACVISECAIIGSSENEMTKIIINDGSLNKIGRAHV